MFFFSYFFVINELSICFNPHAYYQNSLSHLYLLREISSFPNTKNRKSSTYTYFTQTTKVFLHNVFFFLYNTTLLLLQQERIKHLLFQLFGHQNFVTTRSLVVSCRLTQNMPILQRSQLILCADKIHRFYTIFSRWICWCFKTYFISSAPALRVASMIFFMAEKQHERVGQVDKLST